MISYFNNIIINVFIKQILKKIIIKFEIDNTSIFSVRPGFNNDVLIRINFFNIFREKISIFDFLNIYGVKNKL